MMKVISNFSVLYPTLFWLYTTLFSLFRYIDVPFQEGLVVGNWFVGNVVYTVKNLIPVRSV